MRKRILIVPSWYPSEAAPRYGIFIEDQAVVLSRIYDVMVYVLQVLQVAGWRDLFVGPLRGKGCIEYREGVKVYRERVLVPPWMPTHAFDPYRLWATRRGLEKVITTWGKPDLIHAHVVLPAGWAAMKFGLDCNIPVVLTEHTGPFSLQLRSNLRRTLVRETLARVNRVLAVSPALAHQIHAFHPAVTIDVVGNVIRTDFFTPLSERSAISPAQPHTRFLSVGWLSKEKGVDHLLKAAQLLLQRGITTFELIIGGDGPDLPFLRKMASELRLSDRCRFLGMLSRTEVRYWMQHCDMFVLPSLSETFGIVVGEAMACGKPVISTRCGGPEILVTAENGMLVNVADPERLADAMEGFVSGKFVFDTSGIRQSIQERFGDEAFLPRVSAIYEQLWEKKSV